MRARTQARWEKENLTRTRRRTWPTRFLFCQCQVSFPFSGGSFNECRWIGDENKGFASSHAYERSRIEIGYSYSQYWLCRLDGVGKRLKLKWIQWGAMGRNWTKVLLKSRGEMRVGHIRFRCSVKCVRMYSSEWECGCVKCEVWSRCRCRCM